MFSFFIIFYILICAGNSHANEVEIVDAQISCKNNLCRIDVTVEHNDSGWKHYADSWRILTADGQELGKRVLLHPHVNEQPFTRSLSNLNIPSNIKTLWIEAHDSVHGVSHMKFRLDL